MAQTKQLDLVSPSSIVVSGCDIPFSPSVRNLGLYLDQNLNMEVHVSQLCKSLYFQLRKLSKIRPFLSIDAAKKLATAFILSRLDYCNALLVGLPQDKLAKLQRIQNHAARIVLRRSRRDHATPLLRSLHWLPVRARIDYKIAYLCFQCLHSTSAPSYLCDLLEEYSPSRALRSQDAFLLSVPRHCLASFGKKAFSVYAPTLWNSLPLSLRSISTLSTFKIQLKTHLFNSYLS